LLGIFDGPNRDANVSAVVFEGRPFRRHRALSAPPRQIQAKITLNDPLCAASWPRRHSFPASDAAVGFWQPYAFISII